VRWVNVSAGHTISWSIQPHKKSLNFGIFKHPGGGSLTPSVPSSSSFVPNGRPRGSSNAATRNDKTFIFERLQAKGLKQVHWVGKCEADKVTLGKYDVGEGQEGMYALVFDNTFSKTVSKTATFVLMTYPTNAPPKSGHHMHYAQAMAGASASNLSNRSSPTMRAAAGSSESLPHELLGKKRIPSESRPKSSYGTEPQMLPGSSFFSGVLQKKRRKRNQGWARRYFSLDFTSSTLSYYRNNHSSALRGAIPLSLAVIGANEKSREISVDSGAEVWHLRANNRKEFEMWRDALDKASRAAIGVASPTLSIPDNQWSRHPHTVNESEEREWARVESLVGRIAGTRDAVRRLAQDTDPKYHTTPGLGIRSHQDAHSPIPSDTESAEYLPEGDRDSQRKAFWKRKASSSGNSPSGLFRRSVSAQLAAASPGAIPPVPPLPNGMAAVPPRSALPSPSLQQSEEGIHDHCMALLRDLDSVVEEFSALLTESRNRRMTIPLSATTSRKSMESQSSDEFFDATDGGTSKSQIFTISRDSDYEERDIVSDGESESSSEDEGTGAFTRLSLETPTPLFPQKPKSLTPLPLDPVKRRGTVPAPRVPPPSLISFLRKNVGKDLSTIAMPVTANEPTSLLQRVAEQLEYSELLDAVVNAQGDNGERLAHIAAFAISSFSNARVKDRAIRKPFNPMLGETYELVREDKGFRFIAEKVTHRPEVRVACQAESQHWTFLQSPLPRQKFWGKSAELNTDGRVRVFFHATQEHYSWTVATSFLRNVVAGEKYVEPVGTMTIINENTGAKSVCTFKAGGMFAGRSEEVSVQIFDNTGNILPLGLQGKWTSELQLIANGQPTGRMIWKAGSLVDKPAQHYGLTTFAASLNEITQVEKGHLPATDTRLRPDQRAYEEGETDRAEALKARLEERQRARRRVMEEHGEEWVPRWFAKVSSEEAAILGEEDVWKLKTGKDGYWEERAAGKWEGVLDVFQV